VTLDRVGIEQFGQLDLAGKDLGAVLVGDAQRVAEALGDDQQGTLALALEQGVRCDRGAHLDGGDVGRDRRAGPQSQDVADALDRGVAVALRILRQQLVRHQSAIRLLCHHVGEGAAAIDPELPMTHPKILETAAFPCDEAPRL
jgi:hypothetical protein